MNSSYSSNSPGAIHPILHIVLMKFFLFFKSSQCKIASAARVYYFECHKQEFICLNIFFGILLPVVSTKINSAPKQHRRPLPSVLFLSFSPPKVLKSLHCDSCQCHELGLAGGHLTLHLHPQPEHTVQQLQQDQV